MNETIPRVPVSGTWVRHVPGGEEPIATRRRRTPGRFHQAGEVALDLADRTETAWAEWYRALAERGQAPDDDVPRDLYRISVDLNNVVDVSTTAARTELGLPTRMRPAASQWRTFQKFATSLRAEGAEGVLYSSAARTRSLCLCVFEAGLSALSVVEEPITVVSPPPPPRGLRT